MFDLARQFEDSVHSTWENYRAYRNQLGQAKKKIDLTSIVLPEDFLMSCVEPAMRYPSYFGDLFHTYGRGITAALDDAMLWQRIDCFDLTFKQLTPAMQTIMRRTYNVPVPDTSTGGLIQQARWIRDGKTHIFTYTADEGVHERSRAENRSYRAIYVGEIINAMNRAPPVEGLSIWMREAGAFRDGTGDIAVRFWQDVARLKDYSGFFPNKPRPRGNNNLLSEEEAFAIAPWRFGPFSL